MQIKITNDESATAGFISWRRLVAEYLQCELKANEHITNLSVGDNGINYFVATAPTLPNGTRGGGA